MDGLCRNGRIARTCLGTRYVSPRREPWGLNPIRAPICDDDGKIIVSEEVAWPSVLGEKHPDDNDKRLLQHVHAG